MSHVYPFPISTPTNLVQVVIAPSLGYCTNVLSSSGLHSSSLCIHWLQMSSSEDFTNFKLAGDSFPLSQLLHLIDSLFHNSLESLFSLSSSLLLSKFRTYKTKFHHTAFTPFHKFSCNQLFQPGLWHSLSTESLFTRNPCSSSGYFLSENTTYYLSVSLFLYLPSTSSPIKTPLSAIRYIVLIDFTRFLIFFSQSYDCLWLTVHCKLRIFLIILYLIHEPPFQHLMQYPSICWFQLPHHFQNTSGFMPP